MQPQEQEVMSFIDKLRNLMQGRYFVETKTEKEKNKERDIFYSTHSENEAMPEMMPTIMNGLQVGKLVSNTLGDISNETMGDYWVPAKAMCLGKVKLYTLVDYIEERMSPEAMANFKFIHENNEEEGEVIGCTFKCNRNNDLTGWDYPTLTVNTVDGIIIHSTTGTEYEIPEDILFWLNVAVRTHSDVKLPDTSSCVASSDSLDNDNDCWEPSVSPF